MNNKSNKLITVIRSCFFTSLFLVFFGISSSYASYAPVPPRAPVGSTVVLVPAHYGYYHQHRVFIPAHYVTYVPGTYGCGDRCLVWVPGHRHHGHWIRGHYRYCRYYYYYENYYRYNCCSDYYYRCYNGCYNRYWY